MIETTSRPLIGLTPDREEAGAYGYSKFPWYVMRENYATSIIRAGGLPVALALEVELVPDILHRIDGLVLTGGAFDIDPALFGQPVRHERVTVKPKRTDFEMALTRAALAADLPILGICGGEQLLNVALGGTLIQHIPDEIPDALAHEQTNPRDEASHEVEIVPGSRLYDIVGAGTLAVNSAHHQAVKEVAPSLAVNARAPDGVIEGIEDPERRFCIGVEWHPEFEISIGDRRLLAAFTEAAHGG
ncbi:MAG: gamma-glutamyl-gamma-aminobutyrate hydrolase family protein [Alphaproteobacteria bacterium]|nr:MAG: gamma-glutamyl-gamma-aminobutyrate hydrolase family protein [Alphaproteobacteria bacterium]